MNTPVLRSDLLDPNYGNGGVAYPDPLIREIADTVPSGDGRICIGTSNDFRYALFRVDSQGNLDKSFGEKDGLTTGNFKEGFNADGRGVQLLSDGRILITGLHHTSRVESFPALARFSENGHLDKDFGESGHKILEQPPTKKKPDSSVPTHAFRDSSRPNTLNNVQALAQSNPHTHLADGKIYLTYKFPRFNSVIFRLDVDGNLDRSFNARGYKYLSSPLGLDTYAGPIHLDGDKIVLGGYSVTDAKTLPCVICLNISGEYDKTFGDGGYAFVEIENSSFHAIDKRMDGTIVCAGQNLGTSQKGLIAAFDDKGHPLQKFKNSITDFGGTGGVWTEVASLVDGTIISVGSSNGGHEADVLIGRFSSNGKPDINFGSREGWEPIALGNSIERVFGSTLQSDGKTLISGMDSETGENGNEVRKGFLLRCLTQL